MMMVMMMEKMRSAGVGVYSPFSLDTIFVLLLSFSLDIRSLFPIFIHQVLSLLLFFGILDTPWFLHSRRSFRYFLLDP